MLNNEREIEHSVDTRGGRRSLLFVATAVLVTFGLIAAVQAFQSGLSRAIGPDPNAAPLTANTTAPILPVSSIQNPDTLTSAFSNVAKTIGPAVVHINVVQEVSQRSQLRGFGFGFPESQMRPERGSGSGVIVNPNGYIITNNHVVGSASSIEVKLADGRRLKGTVVGTDPETDLAVVRIDAENLPSAALGDSDQLGQGDWVVAVGSPFGLEQTITAGIVSATGRRVTASPYDTFIQTDASINPGNSGGPLVNLRGEVIGINTLIFSRTGGNQGIGFAIPSNLARKIYDQLITGDGRVIRGYLGVNITDLDPVVADSLGIPEGTKGALVSDVAGESSPAAAAGIRSGDVITNLNGETVTTALELTSKIADVKPGTRAEIAFYRDGEEQTAVVTVGKRPERGSEVLGDRNEGDPVPESSEAKKLGVTVESVTPELASQLRLKIPYGAVITGVEPTGAAAEAGLRRGDVIHRFNRTQIGSKDDLVSALSSSQNRSRSVLQVERRGQLEFVVVEFN